MASPPSAPYAALLAHLRETAHARSTIALLEWDQETYMPPAAAEDRAAQLSWIAGLIHQRMTDPALGKLLDQLGCETGAQETGEHGPPVRANNSVGRASPPAAAASVVHAPTEKAGTEARPTSGARTPDIGAHGPGGPCSPTVVGSADSHASDPSHTAAVAANVREVRREFDRATKLPGDLVKETARTASLARVAWQKARAESNFAAFAPHLEKLIELKRRAADCLGWNGEPYDALMDEYEPGARASDVQAVFDALKSELAPLAAAIASAKRRPDLDLLRRPAPVEQQRALNRRIAEAMGFDFDAGRVDTTTHPFCSGLTPRDVRLTNRYDPSFAPQSIFGLMHEAGHGLYEQGFDPAHAGTPMAAAVSLGIHESQSRLWENLVGRSRGFWEHFFPILQRELPAFADVTLDAWWFAINAVQPSFIRVEADEVTYGLHVMLRFDLERALIGGRLAVRDVPAAWNDGMKSLLGITPPDDARGCLQDIHWAIGIYGYFPTYVLGNLYAAQFFEAANVALPDLPQQIRRGELRPLREWLRNNIHRHGMRYRASELVQVITGGPLKADAFVSYLREKYGAVYGV